MSIAAVSFPLRRLSGARFATLARYFTVGAVSSLMDYAVFALLNALLGLPAWPANFTSYTGSSVVNYLMHRRWTFGHRSQQPAGTQFLQYGLMVAVALAANTWLVSLFVPLFSGLVQNALSASVAAKLAAAAVLGMWNLASSNFVVFRGEAAG